MGRGGDPGGGELKCYIHTYRHTDRASDEAGPRGAFAPNNLNEYFPLFLNINFQFKSKHSEFSFCGFSYEGSSR